MREKWTEQYMRERFPEEVREKRLKQGLDPVEKPTHQWLRENGYRQFLRRARELGYTPDEFLLEECGFEQRTGSWPCDDAEVIAEVEEWLEFNDVVGERINGQSVRDARTHLRRIMEISESAIGTRNLLKYGRGDNQVCFKRGKRLMEALRQEFENSQSRANYVLTFRDFLHAKYQEGVVDHDPISSLVARVKWTGTPSRPEHVPSTDLVCAYFEACETQVEQLIILSLAGHGIRPSGLAGNEDRDSYQLDAEIPHIEFSQERKNGVGRTPLMVGVEFLREYFQTLSRDPEWDGTLLPSDRAADGSRVENWIRDKVEEIGERAEQTMSDGSKPTPKDFRQFWYTNMAGAYDEWIAQADTVASLQGASSGKVAAGYVGDSQWFEKFLRYMRPILRSAFPEDIEPVDELGDIEVDPSEPSPGQTSFDDYLSIASFPGFALLGAGRLIKMIKCRLTNELTELVTGVGGRPGRKRALQGSVVATGIFIAVGLELASVGIALDLVEGQIHLSASPITPLFVGLIIGLLHTLWVDKNRQRGLP